MSVLFAVHNSKYPRNNMLRRMQSEQGLEAARLVEVQWQKGRFARLYWLLRSGLRASKGCKVIFVSEFSLQYAVLGWVIAKFRGATLVVDHFVGAYETHVLDYRSVDRHSLRAKYFQAVDALAFWLADIATIDTDVRAVRLAQRHRRANTRVVTLPVGSPDWARVGKSPDRKLESAPLRLLYYGNYIPLHGVPFVVEALGLVKDLDFHLTLIGSSPERAEVEGRLAELGLINKCDFLDQVSETELAGFIRMSHVVLGVFGTTYKAQTVLANKVWQGLYSGRTVVTGSSRALEEIQDMAGPQLVSVDTSDPGSLARAVRRLAASPAQTLFDPPVHRFDQHVRGGYEKLFRALEE